MTILSETCRCPCCAIPFAAEAHARETTCPACGERVRPRWLRHEAALARRAEAAGGRPVGWREGVCLLAEDIRSRFNVGSLFRSMDGLGGLHLFLTGICCTPPDREIHRTALGADETVPWSYATGALPIVAQARQHGLEIVALEATPHAIDLRAAPRLHPATLIVVGNEIEGVSPEVLARCDRHVHVPMRGHKRSLNVAVAAALALWRYTAPPLGDEASSGPP